MKRPFRRCSAHLVCKPSELSSGNSPQKSREGTDPQARLHSQFDQMVAFTQGLGKRAPERRAEFWSRADSSSQQRWVESTRPLRDEIWNEIFGRLPDPSLPPNARTRQVYDTPQFHRL